MAPKELFENTITASAAIDNKITESIAFSNREKQTSRIVLILYLQVKEEE